MQQHDARERELMGAHQIAGRGVGDQRVLDAMRRVPREAFIPENLNEFAYADTPLPIGEGQTISQPYIVALMIEAAEIEPGDKVLEIGTGSGYAAAVVAAIGATVYTIERHHALAEQARRRFTEFGYANVIVREGDGTQGWPEAAPFDAILVTAGGPQVPPSLREQLAIGGRMVIPVGHDQRKQSLLKITRRSEDEYDEDDLGEVAFVPLIGTEGWQGEGRVDEAPAVRAKARSPADVAAMIRDAAVRLPDIAAPDFAANFDALVSDARVVLLGEASHGTSEFYRARAAITRRLIEQHGFTIVAAEADWPDAAAIDRYVRHKDPRPPGAAPAFQRFPTWMWRNREVDEFVGWLRAHNAAIGDSARRTGFYGLDIYSLHESINAVVEYLDKTDPETARVARERYGCLTPWQKDPAAYGRAALTRGYATCENAVLAMLRTLLAKQLDYAATDRDSFFDAAQNARLIAAAERYYRAMYYASHESWNLRDRHMFETLENVLQARGGDSKAVVWAHNSHIGNAAATEMGIIREEFNIGQLCRERFGAKAALIGFGTDRGTVAAADDWGGPMKIKRVRPALDDSYERLCRDSRIGAFLLDVRAGRNAALRHELLAPRLERAIGVIYRPETELQSHYFNASLPAQFDGYVWFAETSAVTPLPTEQRPGMPETYPFGV
jgi:protein-L-isoaspartate(D-aspartate) O-methyltransferase